MLYYWVIVLGRLSSGLVCYTSKLTDTVGVTSSHEPQVRRLLRSIVEGINIPFLISSRSLFFIFVNAFFLFSVPENTCGRPSLARHAEVGFAAVANVRGCVCVCVLSVGIAFWKCWI